MGPDIKWVWSALLEVAGNPDRLTAMRSYMTRQSLLRAWGEFQQTYPLIVGPVFTDAPFQASNGMTTTEVARIVGARA